MSLLGSANNTLEIVISARDEASAELSRLQGNLDKLKPVFKSMAVVGVAAFAGIAVAVSKSIDAANEAALAQAQLGAVLKSTGGIAGVSADAAIKLSKSLEGVTTFSDEAVLSAENMLLTFTNIKSNIFPQATKTVLDMATALGTDTKEAAIQLGKALNDPILGVTALRRVGVAFTEQQQEQIKTMVESGHLLEAQTLILKELGTEFGGSAAAKAATFAGHMEQLNNKFNDMQETIGNAFLPLLEQLTAKIGPVIDKIAVWVEANPELAKRIIIAAAAISALVAAVGILGLVLTPVIAGLALLASPIGLVIGLLTIALIPVIILLVQYWDELRAGAVQAFENIGETILVWWDVIRITFTNWGLQLKLLGMDIAKFWEGVKGAFKEGVNFLIGMAESWANSWVEAANTIINALNKIKVSIPSWVPGIGGKSFGISIAQAEQVKLPRFEFGGLVPGAEGTEVPIMAHGGERVVPARSAGRGNGAIITVNIQSPTFRNRDDIGFLRVQMEEAFRGVLRDHKLSTV